MEMQEQQFAINNWMIEVNVLVSKMLLKLILSKVVLWFSIEA